MPEPAIASPGERTPEHTMERTLEARNLTLTYVTPRSTTYAVRNVDLTIGSRDFAGIVGPSGSGKSSLLALLSGLKTPTAGTVSIGDFPYSEAGINERLDFRRREFGFVFQQPFLIPYLSVIENVLVPIENYTADDFARAIHLLEMLDIAELAPKFPNECSGGERVRAAMARGLIHRPSFLFVDEPTASLDSVTSGRVMKVLSTQREHGALIVITHDLEILDEADIVFRIRDGNLIETFQPRRLTA